MAQAIAYDYADIEQFFRSCALAICLQRSVQVKWVPYKDSKILNAMAWVFRAGEPGTASVDIATGAELAGDVEKMTCEFVLSWLKILHEQGPDAAHRYVEKIGRLRSVSYQSIEETFNDVIDINRNITRQLSQSLKRCAQIKLGAGIGLALLSGGAGVLVAGGATGATGVGMGMTLGGGASPGLALMGVGLSNSFAMSVAKSYEGGHGAKAVAIDMSSSAGKALASEGMGQVTSKAAQSAGQTVAKETLARGRAEAQIKYYSQRLGRRSVTAKQYAKNSKRLTAAKGQAHSAGQKIAEASRMRTAAQTLGKAVPVVFAAWDIYDSGVDYQEAVKGL